MSADVAFKRITEEVLKLFLEKNPEWATFMGFHEPYDRLLANGSIKVEVENLRLMEKWLAKLESTVKFDELSDENKTDWRLLEKVHRRFKFSVYEHRVHEKNPEALDGIGSLIFIMLTREYASLEKRIEGVISRLERLPLFLDQFRTSFEECVPVKLWTEIAVEQCQQMPGFFHFLVSVTKGKISEELHEKLRNVTAALSKPVSEHLEWLKTLLPKAKASWVLGREKFEKLLEIRELGVNADEVHRLGVKFLEENKQEMARLAEKISPGKTVEQVLKEIQEDAPRSFEETLEFTRKEVERAKKFVIEHDIATIDEGNRLHVEETPSFMAPLIPTAALVIPGKYEPTQEGIYIITRQKNVEDIGKTANYASLPNTVVHEAYPGHFLHNCRSNRHGSFIRFLSRSPEVGEGWAHYCEEMMMDHGFQGSLKSRLMQVNRIVFRAVRMIVDVKLSCGEMSFDEAVDMLVEEAGMSKNVALAEVRRYTQTPGYALSYLLGKHLILKLREKVKSRMGEKYDEKLFHDTLTANNVPISMLNEIFEQKLGEKQL